MAAQVLDGTAIARSIRREIAAKVSHRVAIGRRRPGLAVLLVGDEPGSVIYVRLKEKDCRQVDFNAAVERLPADTSEAELLALVDRLNAEPAVDGILVQLPLPSHIDAVHVTEQVAPEKDVDGVHPRNMRHLVLREPASGPARRRR